MSTKRKDNDWKKRLGVVFSTDDNYDYSYDQEDIADTLPPDKQYLQVFIDKKNRSGKMVTVVEGFKGREEDLKVLAKLLKAKCGVGGSAKDGQVIIQGDQVAKVKKVLMDLQYSVR